MWGLHYLVAFFPAIFAMRNGSRKKTPGAFDVITNTEDGLNTYRNAFLIVPLNVGLYIISLGISAENDLGKDYYFVGWLLLTVWALTPPSDKYFKRVLARFGPGSQENNQK